MGFQMGFMLVVALSSQSGKVVVAIWPHCHDTCCTWATCKCRANKHWCSAPGWGDNVQSAGRGIVPDGRRAHFQLSLLSVRGHPNWFLRSYIGTGSSSS